MRAADWLWSRRANVFSQSGEDGVISSILDCLPDDDRWCVEFGAADGLHLSNTRHLIANRGFSAVLIEVDERKFNRLRQLYEASPNVRTIRAAVGFSSHDSLDCLLAETPVPRDFSVLSIDIDGNDYHVWNAVSDYRPRVVCIEFNPTIPTEVRFVQDPDPRVMYGSSLASLVDLGRTKGYELAAVLRVNAIFVRGDLFGALEIHDNEPAKLRRDVSDVTWLFSGYDGRVFLRGSRMLTWHGVPLRESRVQPLPRWLRVYPTRYGLIRWGAFAAYLLWSDPRTLIQKARRRWRKYRSAAR